MEAAELIVNQIPAGPIQNEAVMSVIYQWGTRDLAGATAWVDLFQSGPIKKSAEQQLLSIASSQEVTPESEN